MKAAIVCNGIIDDYSLIQKELSKFDFIICADGGIHHLIKLQIKPDVFVGDFDSCQYEKIRSHPIFENTAFFRHPVKKDATDTQLCIDYALENNYKDITIFAALGKRIDHELSNIFHLEYIKENGGEGSIFSEKNIIYMTDNHIRIKRHDGFKLSAVPLTSSVECVSSKGLAYPMDNILIKRGDSLGISNEFADDFAEISVLNGVLLVILSKD